MNDFLRFGDGVQPSVNERSGLLEQPFYKAADGSWKKLTYASNSLDEEVRLGYNSGGTAGNAGDWNRQGVQPRQTTEQPTAVAGDGVLSKTIRYRHGVTELKITRRYSLGAEAKIAEFKVTIEVTGAPADNLRIWLGTGDDFIAGSDSVKKQVGAFVGDGVYTQTDPATEDPSPGA